MQGSLTRKVVSNTVYNVLGNLVATAVSFCMTPFIIGHVGLEAYGIWAILTMLVGSATLLDPGLSLAFVKFVAASHTRRDFDALNRVVNTGFFFYALFGGGAILVGSLLASPAIRWFNVDLARHPEVLSAFLLVLCAFGIQIAGSILVALQMGLMRLEYALGGSVFSSLLYASLVVLALHAGRGLEGLAWSHAATAASLCAVNLWAAFRILPTLVIRPFEMADRAVFREMLAFGFKIQVAQFARIITYNIDKLLIGVFASATCVSYYHLGGAVALGVLALTHMPVSTLTPAFVELESLGDRRKLAESYRMVLRYTALFAVPVFGYTFASADRLMAIWMGAGDFRDSAVVIRILSAGYLALLVSVVASQVCLALNRPDCVTRYSAIIIATNAALSYCLIRWVGFPWVAFGTAAGLWAGAAYLTSRVNALLGVTAAAVIRPFAGIFGAGVACLVALHALDLAAAGCGLAAAGRAALILELSARGALFSAAFYALCRAAGLLGGDDVDRFRAMGRSFLGRTDA